LHDSPLEGDGFQPFVTDFDEFQKCADICMRYLGVATPTSTTVGVTRLAGPDFMIEIEAVAVVNS
jgi:enamine deaminase RidA (YjgF/YER057c/UK114 family)